MRQFLVLTLFIAVGCAIFPGYSAWSDEKPCECGAAPTFPEAASFLAERGYSLDAFTVLLVWQERIASKEGRFVTGYRLRQGGSGEPFDLYSDCEGNLLEYSQLEVLGIRAKNWDIGPVEQAAEIPQSLAKVLPVTPEPQGIAAGYGPSETVLVGPVDLEAIRHEDEERAASGHKGATRIGVVEELAEAVKVLGKTCTHGAWQKLKDGGAIWAVSFLSPDARGQRIHFAELDIPQNARVVVYNADQPGEAYGPYGPGADIWSATCFAETVTVECYLPDWSDVPRVSLIADRGAHIYADFGQLQWRQLGEKAAGSCNNDITCYSTWTTTGTGIGGIGSIGSSGVLWCTGSLLADTDAGTDIPYFLTANHCVGTQTEANSLEIYWLYETTACNGSAPNPATVPRTTGGADLLATMTESSGTDFCLLRLRNDPPGGITFVGWTSAAAPVGTEAVCVHHPSGDFKRISWGDITNFSEILLSSHPRTRFHQCLWNDGTTEPGSSGSPLMIESTQQIIGQLWGGLASCSATGSPDYYGRFDVSYPLMQTWLDPVIVTPEADFSSAAYSVAETDGVATITVQLDQAPGSGRSISVDYATADGTAEAGSDYTATSGTLQISDLNTSGTFTVPITDDPDFESDETFTVTLSNPVACTLAGSNNPATVTISSDDGPPVTPDADLSSATYSVSETDGVATITVQLDQAPGTGRSISVDYATADGTAEAGSDYMATSGTLPISDLNTSGTFTVPLTDDTDYEIDETFTVTLSNPADCTLAGVNNPATVTITSDDPEPGPPEADFSSATYSVGEAAGVVMITVQLDHAPGTGNSVSVDYATSDGTAKAGSDYTARTGTVIISNSNTSGTFTVSIADDTHYEANETFTVTLSNPVNCTLTGTNNPATVTITDNDPDTDNDQLSDWDELNGTFGYVTDPNLRDTDGDLIDDFVEISLGYDPTDKDDFPVLGSIHVPFVK